MWLLLSVEGSGWKSNLQYVKFVEIHGHCIVEKKFIIIVMSFIVNRSEKK